MLTEHLFYLILSGLFLPKWFDLIALIENDKKAC